MVNADEKRLNHVFHVFCDPTRVNNTVFSLPDYDCGVKAIIYTKKYDGFDYGDIKFGGMNELVQSDGKLIPKQNVQSHLVTTSRKNAEEKKTVHGEDDKFHFRLPKGNVKLLQHLIECMLLSPTTLVQPVQLLNMFDVKMDKPLMQLIDMKRTHGLMSLPRLMFENAKHLLIEILEGSRKEGIEVFFYDAPYTESLHALETRNSYVIYPIIHDNYARNVDLFFNLFHHRNKVNTIKAEMDLSFKEEKAAEHGHVYVRDEISKNWNMTPGTYLRESVKHVLSKFGINKSGGRRSCKKGTRRHSKKKGTRRR